MTQKEAAIKTRYFSEGVSAKIWCYHGEGDWIIKVDRDGSHCSFYNLDSLKRAVFDLHNQVLRGNGELRLEDTHSNEFEAPTVRFYSPENARSCVGGIRKALEFIQFETTKEVWHEVPATIFTDFGNRQQQTLKESCHDNTE